MHSLLTLSRLIDALNERVGKAIAWLVLAAVLVSTGNAIARKTLDFSSNAFLELQWYMFSAIFLLGGAYALLKQEHVRIDILYSRFSRRTQVALDIFGTLLFLLPFALLILWLSWPFFLDALRSGEHSPNPGGLLLWPAKLLIPSGFLLLLLQGGSEFIKRVAFLAGMAPDPSIAHEKPAEPGLVESIQASARPLS